MRTAALVCALWACATVAYAAEPLRGRLTEISTAGVSAGVLRERLGYVPTGVTAQEKGATEEERLTAALDALLAKVAEVIDVQVPGVFVFVEVVPDRAAVAQKAFEVLGIMQEAPAVYVHERQTVYVAADDFSRGVLSHEFSHALISAYFVVPPPEKMQEVLSGYAEYMLTKDTAS
jgi:hypothetical protein